MHRELNDDGLAKLSREGDGRAFDELVERWQGRIFALCFGILGNEEDARDATQEAFISAYRNISSFRGDSKFSSWLHRIAVNASISSGRRKTRRSEIPIETENGDELPSIKALSHSSPSKEFEIAERSAILRRAITTLPTDMREALVMKEFQEMTFAEIAETLQIPLSTVKSRVYSGLEILRKRLKNKGI